MTKRKLLKAAISKLLKWGQKPLVASRKPSKIDIKLDIVLDSVSTDSVSGVVLVGGVRSGRHGTLRELFLAVNFAILCAFCYAFLVFRQDSAK